MTTAPSAELPRPPGVSPSGYRDAPLSSWDAGAPVDPDEAAEFIGRCHAELPKLGPVEPRLTEVREQIAALGTYIHTRSELVHGARMAWRNASRCIGRVYWRSLVVVDRRGPRDEEQIFDDLVSHLRLATGEGSRRGQLRPVISIFGQAVPGRPLTRVWNDQLIRYAGYRTEDGVRGDPRYEQFTQAVTELGWQGKGGPFDLLPVVLQRDGQPPRMFELPEDAVLEVPLSHPEHPWFAELGLRWHAVPAIANMRLSIGGVSYPLAPFNGWYLGAEIGARNLADADRYDQIPVIAARLGLDTSSESTLWRDRALVELNRAVLWSYQNAGVRMTDHHTESRLFLTHLEREERAGRPTPADWSWIVPPISGGLTPVFHRYYHEADLRPNFYLDEAAQRISTHGGPVPVAGAETVQQPSVRQPTVLPSAVPVQRCPVTGAEADVADVEAIRSLNSHANHLPDLEIWEESLHSGSRLEASLLVEAEQLQAALDRQAGTVQLLDSTLLMDAVPAYDETTVLMDAVPAFDPTTLRPGVPASLVLTIDEPLPARRGLRRLFGRRQ